MRVSEAFPSKYLKAANLQGKQVKLVMDKVELETMEQDGETKPVLYFQGTEKGLVLNITNANTISDVYGDDTDDWSGREVVLFEAMVQFKSKVVPAIRIKVPKEPLKGGKAPGKSKTTKEESEQEMSDEIPF